MKGFTLIEIMVTLFILLSLIMIVCAMISGTSSNSVSTYGWGGYVEMRCINGLEFTVSRGHARQVYDQLGHGVVCTQK